MTRNLVEYTLALEQAKHPRAGEARKRTELALDSMAEEINTYGASNAEEGLPLEALSIGLMAFGANPQWEMAANVYANYLVNHLAPGLTEAKKARPESLAAFVLWRRVRERGARSCEVGIGDCLKAQKWRGKAEGDARKRLPLVLNRCSEIIRGYTSSGDAATGGKRDR